MYEGLFHDPHSPPVRIVVDGYAIAEGVIIDTGLEFESLLVTALAKGQIASRKHLVDSTSPGDQMLKLAQHRQHRRLAGAVGAEEHVRFVELELEVGQAAKVVRVESLKHGKLSLVSVSRAGRNDHDRSVSTFV